MSAANSSSKVIAGRVVLGIVVFGFAVSALSQCGGEEPAGPDVRGMTLPDARAELKEDGVEVTVHAEDALMGILVEENFVVCDVEAVNDQLVRLEVAKHGC